MIKFHSLIVLLGSVLYGYSQKLNEYTFAPKDSIFDIYFNTSIEDPYQWMEDPDDPRLVIWLEEQDKLARKTKRRNLETLDLRAQIAAMYYGVRTKKHHSYKDDEDVKKKKYQFKYKLRNTNRSADLLFRPWDYRNYRRLVDIRKLRADKNDNLEIEKFYVNEEEDLVAVEFSHNGSDWRELHFFDLITGDKLEHSLKHLRIGSSLIWQGRSLYYDRYDAPIKGRELLDKAKGQRLYFHNIGEPQEEDILLYINSDISGDNSFDFVKFKKRFFLYSSFQRAGITYRILSECTFKDKNFESKTFLVYPDDESLNMKIDEVFENQIILKTNWEAPNGRVLVVDLKNHPNKPKELVPEYDVVLKEVNRLGKDKLACIYRNDGKDLALIYDLEGRLHKTIGFPKGKKVGSLYENDEEAKFTDFNVSSFYHPKLWYQISLDDFTFKPATEISVPYDSEKLETRYVKYKSKDGAEIPMYITCHKDVELNGNNPTLLYGYGGYGITVEPKFNESLALWLVHGGILAVPNVRGGGAVGADWALEGRRLKKQNAIDDFISAADFLIEHKYTNPNQLGAMGGSHGGLLVTASAIQRPELFKTIVAEAGPYDMLRFSKFTVGDLSTNIKEFGTVSNFKDFENILGYSPMHNVNEDVKYPNMLLITGDSDDRVPPHHSYKFLATLQEKADATSLYVMYVVPGSGHGGAVSIDDWVDKILYEHSFLYYQLFE